MKKLLSLLGGLSLITVGATTVVSCVKKDDADIINEPTVAKDAKILNSISKEALKKLQKYANEKAIIDETNYGTTFDALYNMVSENNPTIETSTNDPNAGNILKLIQNGFNSEFENINHAITNEYSNYYLDSKPLTINERSIKYSLNFINLQQLGSITGVDVTNVNAVRLDFSYNFTVKFKELSTILTNKMSYTLTNNSTIVNDLLSGVITKVTKPIVNYFNTIKSIEIDNNPDFQSLYDNFDIIYTNNYTELDNTITKKFKILLIMIKS